MLSIRLYYPIYFLIITIATLIARVSPVVDDSSIKRPVPPSAIILCLFMILFIGTRPSGTIFADMSNYYISWISHFREPFHFNFHTSNIIFDNLLLAMSSWGMSITSFYLLISAIYFSCILLAANRLFPQHTLFAFLVYLAAFSTLSYATNGIKAGVAASLFLVAITYRERRALLLLFLALSYGFHHSMEVPILAFIVVSIIKNQNVYFYFWILTLVLALLHVTFFMGVFANIGDEGAVTYLVDTGEEWFKNEGFRIDFVIYSAVPILLGRWLKYKYQLVDEGYVTLLNLYSLCNSIWLLCMYAAFTNRIAYLSWFLYPFVLIYPFLKTTIHDRQFIAAKSVSIIHLSFSLFMFFVYYGSQYR